MLYHTPWIKLNFGCPYFVHSFTVVFPPILVVNFRLGVVHFWLYLPSMFGDFIWCLPKFDVFPNSQVCLSPSKVSLLTGWFVVKIVWIFSARFDFVAWLILLLLCCQKTPPRKKTNHCKPPWQSQGKTERRQGSPILPYRC